MFKGKINSAPVRATIMAVLGFLFMFCVSFTLRPGVENICDLFLSLDGYSDMIEISPQDSYMQLSDIGITKAKIFISTDGSSREFAVVKTDKSEQTDKAITIFQARADELMAKFADNPDELLRIKYFRIVNIDSYVTFTVYDTDSTAENLIHNYFYKQ